MSRAIAVGLAVVLVAATALIVVWIAASKNAQPPLATYVIPTTSALPSAPDGVVLPNRALTPGVASADVTPENISMTICVTGYTSGRRLDDGRTVRPPESYTAQLKIEQIAQYSYADSNPKDYEEDHLIPLEVGGDGYSASNLWPEPYAGTGAHAKDDLENRLHELVCSGQLGLRAAQNAIAINWYAAYRQYVVAG